MFFRKVLFWLHLAAGARAGLVIAIMSFTGAVLAFEHEIVTWAERDVRRVEAPIPAAPLPLDELLARARATAAARATDSPRRVAGVTVSSDPGVALVVDFGREAGEYLVDPYRGEVRVPVTTRTHDFMHVMEDWHRRLAATGEHRDTGRAITGAANAVFLFLAVSGLWLWWPRAWSARVLRPSLWFTRGASGRARDWNWHNVVGFWSLPVLIVLTTTGLAISYRWASDLAYRAVGEAPPAPGQAPLPDVTIERPAAGERLTFSAALARFQAAAPGWTEITLREGLPPRRGPAAPAGAEATPPAGPRRPQPYSATIRANDGSPIFATSQLVLHPYSGEILSRTGYADQSTGRQVRAWLRYLHTGQALGWPGQLIAGLACLGACVLVYTGFALSWRRFFGRPSRPGSAGT